MTAQGEDVLAWLEGAVTRRERVAQAAAALQDDPENGWGIVDDSSYAVPSKRRTISPHIGITHEPESAEHIVLNNPADVLRRCAADRKLLALHNVPTVVYPNSGARADDRRCVGCGFDSHEEPMVDDVNDCPTLNALAEGYGWTGGER